jgi:orotidine-5'-phosphate decarboxylase
MLDFNQISESERIIVALDCDRARAMELAEILKGRATWLKVGMTLFYQEGPEIVRDLKALGYKVFLDLKLHDIPHQVEGAAEAAIKTGADMLTIHAFGGIPMMRAAMTGVQKANPEIEPIVLAVTVLTSMDQAELNLSGVPGTVKTQVLNLARLVKEAGVSGVVCSPLEADEMLAELGPEAAIVTPGVRPAGVSTDDQTRVATPRRAFDAGASHIVIGRPITAAPDPAAAFDEIVKGL